MAARSLAHARWWLAYPVAVILLAALDMTLGLWRPLPIRLPEQFSPAYLRLVVADIPKGRPAIVAIGDSVLWGYGVEAKDTAAALLQSSHPQAAVVNLSYEGGSMPNGAVLLRELFRAGVVPAAVVANVNVKEFNVGDSAYKTLHPSLERLAAANLTREDRNALVLHPRDDLNARLNDFVERWWRFYRLRADLRERLFGTDDMAGALARLVHRITGELESEKAAHRATADRFAGTYDLAPIGAANVGMIYYRAFVAELCARGVPALLFLTPTNHRLLHDYIDDPAYDANLRVLQSVPHCRRVRVLNWDRAIPANEFIDNDHLTAAGQRRLAALIAANLRTNP